ELIPSVVRYGRRKPTCEARLTRATFHPPHRRLQDHPVRLHQKFLPCHYPGPKPETVARRGHSTQPGHASLRIAFLRSTTSPPYPVAHPATPGSAAAWVENLFRKRIRLCHLPSQAIQTGRPWSHFPEHDKDKRRAPWQPTAG